MQVVIQGSETANDSAIIAFLLDLAFLSLNFLLRLKGRPLGRHPARTLPTIT
jgi:hypothetical protein